MEKIRKGEERRDGAQAVSRMDGFTENLTDVVRERYEFGCKFIAGFFREEGL